MTNSPEPALQVLESGPIEVLGLLPYSSNYTFLARVGADPEPLLAVYKPRRGEQPLWDFPSGTLASREVAAYLVSEAAGWGLVPPTVLREDGPLGPGSLQLFVEHDPERHYLLLMEKRRADLEVFAAFDVVINNADRKSGHVLEDGGGRLWAVDHGLTFHPEPKLRTVIWTYAGEAISGPVLAGISRIADGLRPDGELGLAVERLLDDEARLATLARADALLEAKTYPEPSTDRPLPWPLV